MRKKVVLGLSGGMDSAFAAIRLINEGYEVLGLYLKMDDSNDGEEDAERLAEKLGIGFDVFDATEIFEKEVIIPFVNDYTEGRTPNPCIACNPNVKFKLLAEYADKCGIEPIATGHYSKPCFVNGRYSLAPAFDGNKDQGYFLYRLPQAIIARSLMPLFNVNKTEIKSYFADKCFSFPKGESTDICFASDDYRSIIKKYTELPGPGCFVDEYGKVLGKHKGIHNYTVGQRKGLGVALGKPAFVKRIDPCNNSVVLAFADSAVSNGFTVKNLNFLASENVSVGDRFKVKVRYRAAAIDCFVSDINSNGISVSFYQAQRVTAPGQSAVFYYDNGIIAFGGIIC